MEFLINALGANFGGARRHLEGLLSGLARADAVNRYRFLIAGKMEAASPAPNVVVDRVGERRGAAWRAWNEYQHVFLGVRGEPVDAVVTLTNLGVVSRRTKNIVFQRNALYFADLDACHIPRGMRPRLHLQRALALAGMKRADLVLVPSQAMKDLIVERAPWAARRDIAVMPHGFEPGRQAEPSHDEGEEAFPKDGTLTLFYPAGPAPHKDFETLIRAVKLLADSGAKARLLLTARYEAWPEVVVIYERLIRDLALQESVQMLGLVSHEEMDGLYGRADIVVFPSLCESFGYPLLEAMSWRKPIAASSIPINREMCAEGAAYFEPSDPESLAEAVLSLCQRPERERIRHGQEARLASRDWGWPAYCREFRSTLEKVAG